MPLAILPALCVGSLAGADDEDWLLREERPFVDIRFGLGRVPIPQEYDVHVAFKPAFGGGSTDYTDHVDGEQATTHSYAIVGGNLQPFGPVYGLEVVHARTTQEFTGRTTNGTTSPATTDPGSLQFRTTGGNAMLGGGWQISRMFHLEVLAVGGLGSVDMDFVDPSSGTRQADGHGWYWNAGVRAGAYATYRHFEVGLSLETTRMQMHADADWVDANTKTTSEATGIGVRFEVGYHIQ